jgi:hypothetical protein
MLGGERDPRQAVVTVEVVKAAQPADTKMTARAGRENVGRGGVW